MKWRPMPMARPPSPFPGTSSTPSRPRRRSCIATAGEGSGQQVGPFGVAAELRHDIGADGGDLEALFARVRDGLPDQPGGQALSLIFGRHAGMVDDDRTVI